VTGRGIWYGLIQGYGAWKTYKSYGVYADLVKQANPLVVEEVKRYLDELKAADPKQSMDVLEFDSSDFSKGTRNWRAKFIGDLVLFVQSNKSTFGMGKRAEQVLWSPRDTIRIEALGEKWLGKKQKVKIYTGPSVFIEKAEITPEMLAKFESLARGIVSQSGAAAGFGGLGK
jgi:hypothetical protein